MEKKLTDHCGNEITSGCKVVVYHKNTLKFMFKRDYDEIGYYTLLYYVENPDKFLVTIEGVSSIGEKASYSEKQQQGI